MTSGATLLSRKELQLAGFVEHTLLRPLEEKDKKRWLYVADDIAELLGGQSGSGFPSATADVVIGRFCKGMIVSVSAKPNVKTADFKKLDGHDEAWVMMMRGPNAGWRLFGRFARKNLFVGLVCVPRDDCVPFNRYQQLAAGMIAAWEARFPHEPLRSLKYGDYFSDPFDDRDET